MPSDFSFNTVFSGVFRPPLGLGGPRVGAMHPSLHPIEYLSFRGVFFLLLFCVGFVLMFLARASVDVTPKFEYHAGAFNML